MDIKDMIESYNELTIGSFAASTFRIHLYFTNEFLKACSSLELNDPHDLSIEVGYKIINYWKLNSRKCNDTINKIIIFIKSVLIHYDILTTFLKVPTLRIKTNHFLRFYHDELTDIVQYVMNKNDTINSINYQTAIFLMIDSGVRIGELLMIKRRNIDFDSYPMRIYLEETKNKKARYIPFSEFSAPYIKQLLTKHKNKTLFWNMIYNRPFTKTCMRSYYKIMKKHVDIERIHSHRFRKTFASILHENGMTTHDLQMLLDHSKISTTELYIQSKQDSAITNYDKFNNWGLN